MLLVELEHGTAAVCGLSDVLPRRIRELHARVAALPLHDEQRLRDLHVVNGATALLRRWRWCQHERLVAREIPHAGLDHESLEVRRCEEPRVLTGLCLLSCDR